MFKIFQISGAILVFILTISISQATLAKNHNDQARGHQAIAVCHATGSSINPYVKITIDENGLNGHRHHDNDLIPAPSGSCPGVVVFTPMSTPVVTVLTPTPTISPQVLGAKTLPQTGADL